MSKVVVKGKNSVIVLRDDLLDTFVPGIDGITGTTDVMDFSCTLLRIIKELPTFPLK